MAHDRPWYKRNGADLVMATLGFPSIEHKWAYSAIIDLLNDRDRPLADDPAFICGFTGLSKRKWGDVRGYLIAEGYLILTDDGDLTNPRFERERAARIEARDAAAEAGRRGAERKAAKAAEEAQLAFISEKTGGFSGDNREINGRFSEDKAPLIDPETNENNDLTPPDPSTTRGRESASEARGERREEESTTPIVDFKTAASAWPGDALEAAKRLAEIGGVPHAQPAAILRNVDITRKWIADGIDLATTASDAIATVTAKEPDKRVWSLLYFDTDVRKAHALTLNGGKGGKPRKPQPEAPPIRDHDDADPRIADIRKALADKFGARTYASFVGPKRTAFHIDGDDLIVKADTAFVAGWINDAAGPDLRRLAADAQLRFHDVRPL